jgi:streptomycin 6-kinase
VNTFEKNIISIYEDKGQIWLNSLPQLIEKIAAKWHLTDLQPIDTLSYHYVLTGRLKEIPVILKIFPENAKLNKEATALKALAGYGAVVVLNKTGSALLLECAVPGKSLKNYFPNRDQDATKIFCKVMHKLHQAPLPQNSKLPLVRDWLALLDKNWNISTIHLEKARTIKKHLLATSSPPVLLHGDLHHENILANNSTWVVIDPHGVIGEPAYEVAAFIRNPIPDLLTTKNAIDIIKNRITLCANLIHLDEKRIAKWCFVQAVLGHIWCLEDHVDPKHFITLTNLFAALI